MAVGGLFEYQKEGVAFLRNRKAALLADEPGLGKTAQAVRAARGLFSLFICDDKINVCVVAPKSALENWRREWAKWWPGSHVNLFVVNYDVLSLDEHRHKTLFEVTSWDLIILDEAHRAKSPGAKRSQTIYRHIHRLRHRGVDPYVWLLTGTPARNHAGELWTHIVSLRPDMIPTRSGKPMSQEQFEDRFCNVYHDEYGHRRIKGSNNRGELRKMLLDSGFFLRRRKKDVQSQLPDLIYDHFNLTLDKVPDNFPTLPGLDPALTADEILNWLQVEQTHFSTERRLMGVLKVPAVCDYIVDELEPPGKIIVFYHHRDVGDRILYKMAQYQPARVDGRTRDAQAEVDRFQTDPGCRLFLGQISSCGEALNITAARQVAFAEASWSPSDNYQAACRAHRIGMQGGLVVRFLSVPGTIDETIQRTLARKTQELEDIFG